MLKANVFGSNNAQQFYDQYPNCPSASNCAERFVDAVLGSLFATAERFVTEQHGPMRTTTWSPVAAFGFKLRDWYQPLGSNDFTAARAIT